MGKQYGQTGKSFKTFCVGWGGGGDGKNLGTATHLCCVCLKSKHFH